MNSDRIKKVVGFKISIKRKWKFQNISDTMEGFCFVISLRGISRPNTGENDDNDLK